VQVLQPPRQQGLQPRRQLLLAALHAQGVAAALGRGFGAGRGRRRRSGEWGSGGGGRSADALPVLPRGARRSMPQRRGDGSGEIYRMGTAWMCGEVARGGGRPDRRKSGCGQAANTLTEGRLSRCLPACRAVALGMVSGVVDGRGWDRHALLGRGGRPDPVLGAQRRGLGGAGSGGARLCAAVQVPATPCRHRAPACGGERALRVCNGNAVAAGGG
jgi:hypothetical protein